MVRKYVEVNPTEKQLEDIIRRGPELIEEGLRYLHHQRMTARGPLDVLMVDGEGAVVIVELKVSNDEGILSQGIDYYDHVVKGIEGIARAYAETGVDPSQTARLFLISPSFSDQLINRCKWINIPLSLFTFKCIVIEGSREITPIYSEVSIPSIPKVEEPVTERSHVEWISDNRSRRQLEALLRQIRSWKDDRVLVEARKAYLSVRYAGEVFAYIKVRRKSFTVETYDEDGNWGDIAVDSDKELKRVAALLKSCVMEFQQSNG